MEAEPTPPLEAALVARFAAIVGAANTIAAPEQLRTYECDALTSFRARPGIVVLPASTAEVASVVKLAREAGLPIVPRGSGTGLSGGALPVPGGAFAHAATGWPRGKPVVPLELLAVAARVAAVELVRGVLLAAGDGPGSATEPVRMSGLQLPRLAALSVVVGADPLPLDEMRGSAPPGEPVPKRVVPVPIVPESC